MGLCNLCRALHKKINASRHNNNLHFGNGLIVTLLDYIVGRASGQYSPSDPRTSKNHNPFIHDMLLNDNQNRFRKALPVIIGRTQPPTATAIICMKTQICSTIIRHQIL
ncbi:MAG TPA: hypothetical protein VFI70_05960 [Nitrososphaeraceae archaeon]|nr:hypothetical protein [Nitrososphaeraceae archaeon]